MSDPPDYPTSAEIRWTRDRDDPSIETVDLLTLTEAELFAYATSLQLETRWLRAMVHEALTQIASATQQLDQYGHRVKGLITTLDAVRARLSEHGDQP